MTKHYLSIPNGSNNYKQYSVPPEVYNYVLQLEAYINNPESSKLLDKYRDRFHKRDRP